MSATKTTPIEQRAVTIAQAAPILGCTPWQVYKMCRDGRLSAVKLAGGPWAIEVRSIATTLAGEVAV